jgi:hypothetical protein
MAKLELGSSVGIKPCIGGADSEQVGYRAVDKYSTGLDGIRDSAVASAQARTGQ